MKTSSPCRRCSGYAVRKIPIIETVCGEESPVNCRDLGDELVRPNDSETTEGNVALKTSRGTSRYVGTRLSCHGYNNYGERFEEYQGKRKWKWGLTLVVHLLDLKP